MGASTVDSTVGIECDDKKHDTGLLCPSSQSSYTAQQTECYALNRFCSCLEQRRRSVGTVLGANKFHEHGYTLSCMAA